MIFPVAPKSIKQLCIFFPTILSINKNGEVSSFSPCLCIDTMCVSMGITTYFCFLFLIYLYINSCWSWNYIASYIFMFDFIFFMSLMVLQVKGIDSTFSLATLLYLSCVSPCWNCVWWEGYTNSCTSFTCGGGGLFDVTRSSGIYVFFKGHDDVAGSLAILCQKL